MGKCEWVNVTWWMWLGVSDWFITKIKKFNQNVNDECERMNGNEWTGMYECEWMNGNGWMWMSESEWVNENRRMWIVNGWMKMEECELWMKMGQCEL